MVDCVDLYLNNLLDLNVLNVQCIGPPLVSVVTLLYGYFRYLFPLLPVVGLLSPIFFMSLCLSYLSSHNPPILAIGGLPRFLQPSCFLSHIFSAISSLLFLPCVQSISASSSANYTRSSFDFFSYVFHFPSLHSVYTGCSPYPVVLIYLSVMLF